MIDWPLAWWYATTIALAGRLHHPHAGASIDALRRGLELHYHGLGGELSCRAVADARFAWADREHVHLPPRLDRYPSQALNRELYFWLASFLALDRPLDAEGVLPRDLRHVLRGAATSARVVALFPALAARYRRLCAAELDQRMRALPAWDASSTRPVPMMEAAIRYALGSGEPPRDEWLAQAIDAVSRGDSIPGRGPTGRSHVGPFLPVPLWGLAEASARGPRLLPFRRARRRRSEGTSRALTRPHFDAERSPAAIDGECARGASTYPEWAFQRGTYRVAWCAVQETLPTGNARTKADPACSERVADVRKQFEALRQQPGWLRRRESGSEIDLDAYVESAGDARGCGRRSARVYREWAPRARSLAVAALMDVSRSTAAWVSERRAIAIAAEGMLLLGEALHATGDDFALFAFSSDTRLRVRCYRIKGFAEGYDDAARRRLLALAPEGYTRMGAAIRHVGAQLVERPSAQKLLLVLTDGRPHDPADGYEGRYAIEDTRRALLEQRARGVHCYGLAIDPRGAEHLPRLFGPGRHALLADPHALPRVLPRLLARMTERAC